MRAGVCRGVWQSNAAVCPGPHPYLGSATGPCAASRRTRPADTLAGRERECYSDGEGEEGLVIYCVVPPELGDQAYRRLVEHYKDNPNITVILDRRQGDRRRDRSGGGEREQRDRRRHRLPGALQI